MPNKTSVEDKLMEAYQNACDAKPNLVLCANLVEFERCAHNGLTDSQIDYWRKRLTELVYEANLAD